MRETGSTVPSYRKRLPRSMHHRGPFRHRIRPSTPRDQIRSRLDQSQSSSNSMLLMMMDELLWTELGATRLPPSRSASSADEMSTPSSPRTPG